MKKRHIFGLIFIACGSLTLTARAGLPELIHGYVIDQNNSAVVGAQIQPYRYIEQMGVSVGPGHPAGAGFFSPPGDEQTGWYLFDVHLPNHVGQKTVGPFYLGQDQTLVALPVDGRPGFFVLPPESPDAPLVPANASPVFKVAGEGYCGFDTFSGGGEWYPELVHGYVVGPNNQPVSGALVYPYRYNGMGGISVEAGHPAGAGYFSPPGDEEPGWYLFDLLLPTTAATTHKGPVFVGTDQDPINLPTDSRSPFFGPIPRNKVVFALTGDVRDGPADFGKVRDSLNKFSAKKLVMPGDNILSASYEQVWNPWKQAGFTFDVIAIGNHTRGYAEEVAYFKMPGEYFTKVMDGVRFIVLNSDNTNTELQQSAWLDRVLADASERFIFVMYHHPPVTISDKHYWEEKRDFHNLVSPILRRNGDRITGLILGHDHQASLIDWGGIPMIVSGAVSDTRPSKKLSFDFNGYHVESRWNYQQTPHWVRLEVDPGANKVTLQFIRIDQNRVVCTAQIEPNVILGTDCARM